MFRVGPIRVELQHHHNLATPLSTLYLQCKDYTIQKNLHNFDNSHKEMYDVHNVDVHSETSEIPK